MRHIFGIAVCCLLAILVSLLNPFTVQAGHEQEGHEPQEHAPTEEAPFDRPVEEIVQFLGPRQEMTLFPCSDCHDEEWEADTERRDLDEPHDEIPGKFMNHDSENRWCLDCHSEKNRDKLRLINGTLVSFEEYYKLCEQCHKRVYREWKMGVHGKRTGSWNGVNEHWQCTQCHDPHNPPFKPLKPEPAPREPLKVRLISEANE